MPACPMSVLYADHRALASGMAKQKVLDILIKALSATPGVSDMLAGAELTDEAASLTWAEVALVARRQETEGPAPPKPPEPTTTTTTTAPATEAPVTTRKKRQRVDKRPSHKDRAS